MFNATVIVNVSTLLSEELTLTLRNCDGTILNIPGLTNPQRFVNIVKGVNLIPFSLPETYGLYEDVYFTLDYAGFSYSFAHQNFIFDSPSPPSPDPCKGLTPVWSMRGIKECNPLFTRVYLEVSGNEGNLVQFSHDGSEWLDADESSQGNENNARWVDLPSTGKEETVAFRLAICPDVIYYGAVDTFLPSDCSDGCESGCNGYEIFNSTSTIAVVTFEDCVEETYQLLIQPGTAHKICRSVNGVIKIHDVSGAPLSLPIVLDPAMCEECFPRVNTGGGFPIISAGSGYYTNRFTVTYDPKTQTVSDVSTFEAENKLYRIDEGPFNITSLQNYDVSKYKGREISISVIYGSTRKMAQNTAFVNLL